MRYIDADALCTHFKILYEHAQANGMYNHAKLYDRAFRLVVDAPTADVVEVVRCRKCKSSEYTRMCSFGEVYCTWHGCFMHGEGFCNDGEREEN